jgi:hypothetical protein
MDDDMSHPIRRFIGHYMNRSFEEEVKNTSATKEGQIAAGSRTREPTFVGSINTRRDFSHNMQGPIPPVLDLSSCPAAEEALCVTDEFCDKYRVLRMEVEILQEENNRLRRMLENFLTPIMIAPLMSQRTRWETPRGRYDEHSCKFSLSMKPKFNRPLGERNHF